MLYSLRLTVPLGYQITLIIALYFNIIYYLFNSYQFVRRPIQLIAITQNFGIGKKYKFQILFYILYEKIQLRIKFELNFVIKRFQSV
jgi:hypothetical protein